MSLYNPHFQIYTFLAALSISDIVLLWKMGERYHRKVSQQVSFLKFRVSLSSSLLNPIGWRNTLPFRHCGRKTHDTQTVFTDQVGERMEHKKERGRSNKAKQGLVRTGKRPQKQVKDGFPLQKCFISQVHFLFNKLLCRISSRTLSYT